MSNRFSQFKFEAPAAISNMAASVKNKVDQAAQKVQEKKDELQALASPYLDNPSQRANDKLLVSEDDNLLFKGETLKDPGENVDDPKQESEPIQADFQDRPSIFAANFEKANKFINEKQNNISQLASSHIQKANTFWQEKKEDLPDIEVPLQLRTSVNRAHQLIQETAQEKAEQIEELKNKSNILWQEKKEQLPEIEVPLPLRTSVIRAHQLIQETAQEKAEQIEELKNHGKQVMQKVSNILIPTVNFMERTKTQLQTKVISIARHDDDDPDPDFSDTEKPKNSDTKPRQAFVQKRISSQSISSMQKRRFFGSKQEAPIKKAQKIASNALDQELSHANADDFQLKGRELLEPGSQFGNNDVCAIDPREEIYQKYQPVAIYSEESDMNFLQQKDNSEMMFALKQRKGQSAPQQRNLGNFLKPKMNQPPMTVVARKQVVEQEPLIAVAAQEDLDQGKDKMDESRGPGKKHNSQIISTSNRIRKLLGVKVKVETDLQNQDYERTLAMLQKENLRFKMLSLMEEQEVKDLVKEKLYQKSRRTHQLALDINLQTKKIQETGPENQEESMSALTIVRKVCRVFFHLSIFFLFCN